MMRKSVYFLVGSHVLQLVRTTFGIQPDHVTKPGIAVSEYLFP
jgi:hypothetical protein